MIDARAMALAAVAMGIPAIITAAALGSKLGLHGSAHVRAQTLMSLTFDGMNRHHAGTVSAKG